MSQTVREQRIEKILFRRALEKRLDGYTLETAQEISEALDIMCPFCGTLNAGKEGCSVMCNCGTLLVMEAGKWKRSVFDDVDE